jgi:hypothetical protein
VWSNKLGRNLTAEETAAYEEGNRRWAERPRPTDAEAMSWLKQDRKKLTTPKPKPPPTEAQRLADQEYYRRESERRRADYDVARISNDRAATAHHAAKNSPAYRGGYRLK